MAPIAEQSVRPNLPGRTHQETVRRITEQAVISAHAARPFSTARSNPVTAALTEAGSNSKGLRLFGQSPFESSQSRLRRDLRGQELPPQIEGALTCVATERSPVGISLFHQSALGIPEGERPADFLERSLGKVLTMEEMSLIQQLPSFDETSPSPDIIAIRGEVASEVTATNGYSNRAELLKALSNVLNRRGFDASSIPQRAAERAVSEDISLEEFTLANHAQTYTLSAMLLRLLPDETPLFRAVDATAVATTADGVHIMSPNAFNMSYWGVGNDGLQTASAYYATATNQVLVKTSLGELRRTAPVAIDRTAMVGNAFEAYHTPDSGVRVEMVRVNPGVQKPQTITGWLSDKMSQFASAYL